MSLALMAVVMKIVKFSTMRRTCIEMIEIMLNTAALKGRFDLHKRPAKIMSYGPLCIQNKSKITIV